MSGDSETSSAGLAVAARMMLRQADRATLATVLTGEARPYASLVGMATDIDGTPILLLSRLAEHTRAILEDPRVSLLIDGTAGFANPQQGPRVSLVGRAVPAGSARFAGRFLARHPAAELYAGFGDFAFYRIDIERMHWVGGFGRARWLAPLPACDAGTADRFEAVLPALRSAVEGPVGEGPAGADCLLGRLARLRLGRRGRRWRLAGVDPDGCDLGCGKKVHRLAFESPLPSAEDILATLMDLARNIQHAS
ncbi:HugZ family protein [Telmatospirillum siberiense]|uniref:Heme iron utilization protein n=1 Tax=Telmatospirillum siberiense TaxID=382514 RepID=A0A2N3PSE3_9PROT|nr:pyridoxamine 5'-phosphate oxidase family protein [Telmatospirillum siberiense]PKU23296.1 heme iron utilization protein [Telmatospirillum siberiense]